MLTTIYKLITIAIVSVVIYGLALPYLISAKNNELVIVGIILGLGSLPILVKLTIIQIKKLTNKEKK